MEFRYYQREAIDSTFNFWNAGGGNPLIDLATGTGKSLVIAGTAKECIEQYPDLRILMLVHVQELVEQNAAALLRAWPQAPIGINAAGLGQRNYRSQIIYASIQSVFRNPKLLGERNLIQIDEAHLIPREGMGMYLQLFDTMREYDPDLRIAGYTATPFRLGSGRLDRGPDKLFDKTVYTYGIAQGVKDGYLTPLVSKGTGSEIDVSKVAKRGGEFQAGALEKAADSRELIEGACDEICERGADRKSWLAFCSGIDHANHVAEAMRRRGIICESVTSKTPKGQRASIFRAFKAGEIRCLTGMNVFTTGFDAPGVDLIAMMRPTLSTVLYIQMCGRGTRLADGKSDCLVLDFAGNVRRHGPIDDVYVPEKRGKKPLLDRDEKDAGEDTGGVKADSVRAKECPKCKTLNRLDAVHCVDCDYGFPAPKVEHEKKADVTPIMASRGPQWVPVADVRLFKHEKEGSTPSLRVEYQCGMQAYREWVFFQHRNRARDKACAWWQMFANNSRYPTTIEEALGRADELKIPVAVTIKRDENNRKYWRISGYRFDAGEHWLEYGENYRGKAIPKDEAA